jgi:hypothetical protein
VGNIWGALRETELAGVDIGLAQVLVHAPLDAPYAWVHGREIPKAVFPSLNAALGGAQELVISGHVFYIRSAPSVILKTVQGAVLVVDIWGDSKYRALSSKSGRDNVTIGKPIGAIIDRIHASATPKHKDSNVAEFFLEHIRWDAYDPFPKHKKMTSLSNYVVEGSPNIDFVEEENLTPRAHMGKVLKTFRDVNSAKEIHATERLLTQARASATESSSGEAESGLAQIAAFLRNA